MQYHFVTQYRFPHPTPPPTDLSAYCYLFANVYCSPSYVRESGITDKICWFRNFGPPQQYAKYVRAPTQVCLHIHQLFTFITRLIIFVQRVSALALFIQHCITVLASFYAIYTVYIIGKYRTIGITRQPTAPLVRSKEGLQQCFSTFVRPLPGKFFFHKTRARSQQIYSTVPFQFFFKFIH